MCASGGEGVGLCSGAERRLFRRASVEARAAPSRSSTGSGWHKPPLSDPPQHARYAPPAQAHARAEAAQPLRAVASRREGQGAGSCCEVVVVEEEEEAAGSAKLTASAGAETPSSLSQSSTVALHAPSQSSTFHTPGWHKPVTMKVSASVEKENRGANEHWRVTEADAEAGMGGKRKLESNATSTTAKGAGKAAVVAKVAKSEPKGESGMQRKRLRGSGAFAFARWSGGGDGSSDDDFAEKQPSSVKKLTKPAQKKISTAKS